MRTRLCLLFPQEVHNELLIVTNKIVSQSFVLQVLSEMLAPERVEGIQQRKLGGRRATIQTQRRYRRVHWRWRKVRLGSLRRRGGRRMSMEQPTQQAVLVSRLRAASEGLRSRRATCILLTFVHLLFELLCLLLVHEAQSREALLQFKGVEEGPVLIVVPCIEYFLVPDDSTPGGLDYGCQFELKYHEDRQTHRYVHHLQPVGVSNQVVGQHHGSLETSVRPFRAIRIRHV